MTRSCFDKSDHHSAFMNTMRTKRPFLIAVVLIAAGSCFGRDPVQQQRQGSSIQSETCTVKGTVVTAATGQPIKSAHVTLEMDLGQSKAGFYTEHPGVTVPSFNEITDSHGYFTITGVPAGRYRFYASKSGYVPQDYRAGGQAPTGMLNLEPGKALDKIKFQLKRAAVIVGRITDEAGEPLAGVEVDALLPRSGVDNRGYAWRQMTPLKFAVTNDLGEYRIYDLPPNGYYVVATNSGVPELMSSSKRSLMWQKNPYPSLYYPGVIESTEAQEIRVEPGQETRIDLSLQREKKLTLSGRVLDANGHSAARATVMLVSRDPAPNLLFSSDQERQADAQGNFEIEGVLQGSYLLTASLGGGGQSYTERPIELTGTDVSDLELRLSPGLKLSGKLTTTASFTIDFQDLGLRLPPEDDESRGPYSWAQIGKNGTFTIDGVMPTKRRLELTRLPEGWYLRSASFGSQNVLEDGLQPAEVGTDELLNVTVSPGAAHLDGIVLKGDHPVSAAQVRLFPEPLNPHRTDLFRTASTDENGHFVIKNVVPGKYRAVAFLSENDDDSAISPSVGTSIVLAESESKTVRLSLITNTKDRREPAVHSTVTKAPWPTGKFQFGLMKSTLLQTWWFK